MTYIAFTGALSQLALRDVLFPGVKTFDVMLPGWTIGADDALGWPRVFESEDAQLACLVAEVSSVGEQVFHKFADALGGKVVVTTSPAQTVVHLISGVAAALPWDEQAWAARFLDIAVDAAAEFVDHINGPPNGPPNGPLALQWTMMLVRATGRHAAQNAPSPPSVSGLTRDAVQQHDLRPVYTNFFAMKEMDITVPNFSGGTSGPMVRAGFEGTDAAIVLPYDPVTDRVLLVEQFRMGPYLRHDPNPWLMEPVAGRIDAGDTAVETARREAWEEARLDLAALHLVHAGYASPGCSTEYFNVFVGEASILENAGVLAGLEDEHEDIKGHVLDWDTFYSNLQAGHYPVTPLALAGYWLAANRPSLRAKA